MTVVICFVQLVFGDVPLIDKGYLPPVQTTDGARGLGWAEIETVAKGGYKVTLFWVLKFAVVPRDWSKVPGPVQPLFRIRENIENANRSHSIFQMPLERPQPLRVWLASEALQNRLSISMRKYSFSGNP